MAVPMAAPAVPERGIGPSPRISTTLNTMLSAGQHEAHDHRRPRVAGGAERAAQHEEHQHAAAGHEHDAEERQRLGLHRGRGVHQVEQAGAEEVPERSHHQHRDRRPP